MSEDTQDTASVDLESPAQVELKLASYTCHKAVKAGKIIDLDVPRGHITVEQADGSHEIIDTPKDLFARGNANVGDYLVVYDDTYMSWSPAAAFEAGYTKDV